MSQRSKLDNEITQSSQMDQLGQGSQLRARPASRSKRGSSGESGSDAKTALLITRSGVSRRKGKQEQRIQREMSVKPPSCIVDSTIALDGSGPTLKFSLSIPPASCAKLLLSPCQLKTLRKFVTSLLKDGELLRYWAVKLLLLSPDTDPTLASGAATTPHSPRTGARRTKKASSSRGKRSGARK